METKKILIIDDDKDLVNATQTILESRNYNVVSAYNREEGLKAVINEKPNLIILDVQMDSKHAGFDLEKELKKDAVLSKIPILMQTGIEVMTTSSNIADLMRDMRSDPNFQDNKVLLVKSTDGSAGVDYLAENGGSIYLSVEGFLPKPMDPDKLLSEVGRLLK
jgi:CheY-like chemotaxis protein